MGENNETETETAEQQLLMERIEVASEIVRSSQAAVAFQRAFYLEMSTFARVVNEIDEFIENVNRLQSKLSILFNALQHVENGSAAGRCATISEKLETLKNSFDDFRTRTAKAKAQRETKSKELNKMIDPALNSLVINSMSVKDLRGIRPPNFSIFVNDNDFHLAESMAEEWGKLRRKLDNYYHKYLEDTTSLKVEVFGATYSSNIQNSEGDGSRTLVHKLSNLISSRSKSSRSHNQLTHSRSLNSSTSTSTSTSSSGSSNRKQSRPHYARSESFFYCTPTSNPEPDPNSNSDPNPNQDSPIPSPIPSPNPSSETETVPPPSPPSNANINTSIKTNVNTSDVQTDVTKEPVEDSGEKS